MSVPGSGASDGSEPPPPAERAALIESAGESAGTASGAGSVVAPVGVPAVAVPTPVVDPGVPLVVVDPVPVVDPGVVLEPVDGGGALGVGIELMVTGVVESGVAGDAVLEVEEELVDAGGVTTIERPVPIVCVIVRSPEFTIDVE